MRRGVAARTCSGSSSALLVNSLKGGTILHRRVGFCTEGWNLTRGCLEKPLQMQIVALHFCKFGRSILSHISHKTPSLVHPKNGLKIRREALDLPVHLLLLPQITRKEANRRRTLCREFTKTMCDNPLLEGFPQASKYQIPSFSAEFHPSVQNRSTLQ